MKLRTPAPRPSVTLLPAVRLLAAGLAAAVLAACGGKQDAASTGTAAAGEEKVLNVYNYSDYIAEDTIPNFEKQTGIRVTYDVYDSDEVLEAKLLAGNDPTIYPPDAVKAKLFTYAINSPETDKLYTRLWTEIKTGR